MIDTFKELGVSQWLVSNLKNVGIEKPTQIQTDTLKQSLKGKNVIGCAHTGSGKTACFAIPVLEKLAKDPYGIFGLILTPTRELAYQISEQFTVFAGQNLNLRIAVITGGIDMMKQSQALNDIPHIVVATPGRFVHSLRHDTHQLNDYLSNLQFLILDEADRMLTDPTIQPDLTFILDKINTQQETARQTLLFSATMVADYTKLYSKEAIFGKFQSSNFNLIEVGTQETSDSQFKMTVANLDQKFCLVPANIKEATLVYVLNQTKLKKNQQLIVFTSTCRNCHFLAMLLNELGFEVAFIHSQLSQRKRIANLAKFKSQHVKILVATDVASRGLDIPMVQMVVNFDVPKAPKDYVHRVGRTARAGRGGSSLTFVTQYDVKLIQTCEEYIKQKLTKTELPEKEVLSDITHLTKVMQVVRIKMSEQGIEDLFDEFKEKKKRDRKIDDKNQTLL